MSSGAKQGIEHIVSKTGFSRATISRALNNCGSVSSEVKSAVVKAAEEIQYVPQQKKRMKRPDGGFLIASALPENPSFFWGEAMRGMREAAKRHPDIRLVHSLFSSLPSEKDALYCIDYLLDLKPDLLIVAVPAIESIRRRLAQADAPVVCFSESGDVHPLFYVGADFYRDGVCLARAAAKKLNPQAKMLRIESERMPMTSLRDEGFRREMMRLMPGLVWGESVQTGGWSLQEMPALLARALRERTFDALYVSQGHLPQVMTALGKLRKTEPVQVVGFERPGDKFQGDARLAAVMEQDVRHQGELCLEAAWRYLTAGEVPVNGRLLIESKLTTGGDRGAYDGVEKG